MLELSTGIYQVHLYELEIQLMWYGLLKMNIWHHTVLSSIIYNTFYYHLNLFLVQLFF